VLAAFGVGTVPVRARSLAPVLRRAVDGGIDVLVVTQRGGVVDLGMYKNSTVLADAGAIAGGEMRIEAAVPKLMHALAAFPERAARRAYLERDVAGELA
jgi:L-asparaginase